MVDRRARYLSTVKRSLSDTPSCQGIQSKLRRYLNLIHTSFGLMCDKNHKLRHYQYCLLKFNSEFSPIRSASAVREDDYLHGPKDDTARVRYEHVRVPNRKPEERPGQRAPPLQPWLPCAARPRELRQYSHETEVGIPHKMSLASICKTLRTRR